MKTLNKPRYAAGTVHSGINESIMSALQKNKLMTEVEIDQSLVHVPEYLGAATSSVCVRFCVTCRSVT